MSGAVAIETGAVAIYFIEIGQVRILRIVLALDQTHMPAKWLKQNIKGAFDNLPLPIKYLINRYFHHTVIDIIRLRDLTNPDLDNRLSNTNCGTLNDDLFYKLKGGKRIDNFGRFFFNNSSSILAFEIKNTNKEIEMLIQPQDLEYLVRDLDRFSEIRIESNSMSAQDFQEYNGFLDYIKISRKLENKMIKIVLKLNQAEN